MTASKHLHSVQSHRQVEGTSSEGSTITLSRDIRRRSTAAARLTGPGVGGKTANAFEPPQEHDAAVKYI